MTQLFGSLMIMVYAFSLSAITFLVVHRISGLRIRKALEKRGLNQQFQDDGFIVFSKSKKGYSIDFHAPPQSPELAGLNSYNEPRSSVSNGNSKSRKFSSSPRSSKTRTCSKSSTSFSVEMPTLDIVE